MISEERIALVVVIFVMVIIGLLVRVLRPGCTTVVAQATVGCVSDY